MVWEILRYHTREVADPAVKIREARELIKFLAAGQPAKREDVPAMYAKELDHLLNDHDPRVLYAEPENGSTPRWHAHHRRARRRTRLGVSRG
jgi:hypothetical protein